MGNGGLAVPELYIIFLVSKLWLCGVAILSEHRKPGLLLMLSRFSVKLSQQAAGFNAALIVVLSFRQTVWKD